MVAGQKQHGWDGGARKERAMLARKANFSWQWADRPA
jgi:hypothetical protein